MSVKSNKREKKGSRGQYIGAIVVNAIILYIFNNLLNWGVPFLTDRFSGVLWAINLSLGATIIANIFFLIFDADWFIHLSKMILNLIAMFALYLIIVVFPFTFAEESWAVWIKIALVIAVAATGIAFIVELFKLFLGKR